MNPPLRIVPAMGPDDMKTAMELFREYRDYLDVDLCFQDFENELNNLPGAYSPPSGALFLAWLGDDAAGCVALKKVDATTCEMKRLYVRPTCRGHGIGRALATRIMDAAVGLGYTEMVLDTLDRLQGAMALYESMGFRKTSPYYHNPLPGVVYWKKSLE
jgi:GNAT superfamily N-acetyltransferase